MVLRHSRLRQLFVISGPRVGKRFSCYAPCLCYMPFSRYTPYVTQLIVSGTSCPVVGTVMNKGDAWFKVSTSAFTAIVGPSLVQGSNLWAFLARGGMLLSSSQGFSPVNGFGQKIKPK